MDEAVPLQVLHSLAGVLAHGQQALAAASVDMQLQEVEQAAIFQVLSDNADGPLLHADTIELHQLGVAEAPVGRDAGVSVRPQSIIPGKKIIGRCDSHTALMGHTNTHSRWQFSNAYCKLTKAFSISV